MADRMDKGSESEEMSIKTPERASSDGGSVKTCADCGTTKTPLWRGGPAGPKSLCNACGIRSRKKRRALLGLNKVGTEEKKSKKNSNTSNSGGTSSSSSKFGDSLKRRLMEVGREVVLQRSSSSSSSSSMVGVKQRMMMKKKLGEEEQAAVLLMALSCGSVYA